jgi:hypothetical protein
MITVVYCETCGNNVTFTDIEVKEMYQQHKHGMHHGLPKKIYCGYCENLDGKESRCKIVRGED